MSEEMKISFICNECDNDDEFLIYYIYDGFGIEIECGECGVMQLLGVKDGV